MRFYYTDNPGVWTGKWEVPIMNKVNFHDTLVDFGPVMENG